MSEKDEFDYQSNEDINEIAGISVLIENNVGEYLVVDHKRIGKWMVPVGKLNPGETREEAVIREMYEELGIIVKVVQIIGLIEWETRYAANDNRRSFNDSALYKVKFEGEPVNREKEKHNEIKFVNFEKLKEYAGEIPKGAMKLVIDYLELKRES